MKSPQKRIEYEDFYSILLSNRKAYSDVLVLDELIYISKKKYNVPYKITIEFVESLVLPYVEILPLSEKDYQKAVEILNTYSIKPSDALHTAVMILNNISRIASEDKELDNVKEIERVWFT